MNIPDFEKLVDETFAQCRELLGCKNEEYARDGDKLSNFKKSAAFEPNNDPRTALKGMMLKHTTSVYDMLNDLEKTGQEHPLAVWDVKIFDHINYLILLRALLVEMQYQP